MALSSSTCAVEGRLLLFSLMTAVAIEVEKSGNESGASLLRRFTKRVQGAGILNRKRSSRYISRRPSKCAKKKRVLNALARRARWNELRKLGKLPPENKRLGR